MSVTLSSSSFVGSAFIGAMGVTGVISTSSSLDLPVIVRSGITRGWVIWTNAAPHILDSMPQLGSSSKGHQMLQKLGWSPGSGLGLQAGGETRLVSDMLPTQSGRHGLGHRDTGPGGWRKL